MKTILLAFAWLLIPIASSFGLTDIIIHISTNGTVINYSLNNQPMSSEQVVMWVKSLIAKFGDKEPISIDPDKDTTFQTAFELLERLKGCGVKQFVVAGSSNGERALMITAEQIYRLDLQSESFKRKGPHPSP